MTSNEFHKILIVNRGEIAMRVIRAIRELGKMSIIVHSDHDRELPCVTEADEAYSLGSGNLAETYLNIDGILNVAERAGVDACLLVVPYYNKPTQDGLYEHYKAIANTVDVPVILYNVPSRTMCNMLPETVLRLSQIPNIAGLKEASGNIGQIGEIAAIMPEDFILLSGDDPNTLPLIAMGGSGVISVVSNQAPAMVKKLVGLCLQGDFKEAMIWQKKLLPLFKANFIETNPIPVKAGLSLMGKMEANYRLPLTPLKSQNLELLKDIMKETGLI